MALAGIMAAAGGSMAILETVLNAVFIGMGSAIGTYLANKGLTTHMDKLLKRLEISGKVTTGLRRLKDAKVGPE